MLYNYIAFIEKQSFEIFHLCNQCPLLSALYGAWMRMLLDQNTIIQYLVLPMAGTEYDRLGCKSVYLHINGFLINWNTYYKQDLMKFQSYEL